MIRTIATNQTYLTDNEVDKIIDISKSLDLMANFYEADVFIDVLSKIEEEAIVVAQSRYIKKTLYTQNIIGKKALIENEPGVIKCFKTGETIRDIKAITQEFKLVKQNIQPIELEGKVIATLIVEKDISDEVKDEFDIQKNSNSFITLIGNNSFLVDNINSAILIFDKHGYLKIKNRTATELYKSMGYENDIENIHYDKIAIDKEKFESIISKDKKDDINEININDKFLKVKNIYIKDDDFKLCRVIEDITDLKQKEQELMLKAIAIREAHHRVKNNLYTVVSIMRKQSRLSKNQEVKQCLDSTINRVFAILSTHSILSKEKDNNLSIIEAIQIISENMKSSYSYNKDIDMHISGEDFKIEDEKATGLLLVINEVIQNCYDHAFKDKESGKIQILTNNDGTTGSICIVDNGAGFNVENINKQSLGTYIIDSYVEQMLKGSIRRKSSKNGTSILLTIPL